MIKFVIARYEKDGFDEFFSKSMFKQNHEVVHITNEHLIDNGIPNGIFEKYNLGAKYYIDKGLDDNDIVVFCHADVKILDEAFEEKLEYAFSRLNISVAGVIGATELHETGGWWLSDQSLHRGHLIQWTNATESYHMTRAIGNFQNMTVVDGLFMAVRGSLVKNLGFDSINFVGSYDFYDYDYCLEALRKGSDIAVLDILVEHHSNGSGIYKDSWEKNKQIFLEKWKNLGYSFPIRRDSFAS